MGMLTFELSSHVLENSDDAYTAIDQFWLAVQHSVESTASWFVDVVSNEKVTLNINMPYV